MIIKRRWTNEIDSTNVTDDKENPTGGHVIGTGINIKWQKGPIQFDHDKGVALEDNNGAFVEDIILACIDRLEFFNKGKFGCRANSLAITNLEQALMWLQHRHDDRVVRKVQGEYKK